MEYVIEMLNIRKAFPGIVANDNINLQVKKGEIHALLGENGAGKSTLMNVLFGLYQPERGEIRVRMRRCTSTARTKRMTLELEWCTSTLCLLTPSQLLKILFSGRSQRSLAELTGSVLAKRCRTFPIDTACRSILKQKRLTYQSVCGGAQKY